MVVQVCLRFTHLLKNWASLFYWIWKVVKGLGVLWASSIWKRLKFLISLAAQGSRSFQIFKVTWKIYWSFIQLRLLLRNFPPQLGISLELFYWIWNGAKILRVFPQVFVSWNPLNLFLYGCANLESFPEMMENMDKLKELLLDGTQIEVLPSSIERLKGFILLNLRKYQNLVSLSNDMCNLTSLEKLIVSSCSQLNNFPRNLGSLQRLAQLHVDGTAITQPPDSIVLLTNLQLFIYPGWKILAPTSFGVTLFVLVIA